MPDPFVGYSLSLSLVCSSVPQGHGAGAPVEVDETLWGEMESSSEEEEEEEEVRALHTIHTVIGETAIITSRLLFLFKDVSFLKVYDIKNAMVLALNWSYTHL